MRGIDRCAGVSSDTAGESKESPAASPLAFASNEEYGA